MRSILLIILTFLSIDLQARNPEVTKVKISTDYGDIVIMLYNDTPKHRDNFIKLVKDGYYDGQLFHRVIKGFMIQGGDPNSKNAVSGEMLGVGGPGYTIPAEILPHHFHKKGALAAARKGDAVNPSRASSGSQFYIIQGQVFSEAQLQAFVSMGRHTAFTPEQKEAYTTVGGSPHLDGEYTVFGEVIQGFDVLDKIASLPVDAYNRPKEDVSYTMEIIK